MSSPYKAGFGGAQNNVPVATATIVSVIVRLIQ